MILLNSVVINYGGSMKMDYNVKQINLRNEVLPLSPPELHKLYMHPARFIGHVPRFSIDYYHKKLGRYPQIIFDPFAGSGTTAVESTLSCIDSISWDLIPLVKVFVKVKTALINTSHVSTISRMVKNALKYEKEFYPEFPNIEKWYDERVLKVLRKIWGFYHSEIGYYDFRHKEFKPMINDESLWAILSILFLKVSRKLSFSDDSIPKLYGSKYKREYIQKLLASKENVRNIVENKINYYLKKILNALMKFKKLYTNLCQKRIKIEVRGYVDVVEEKEWPSNIDLVVTSPPYLAAHEYTRSLKLEMYWMGMKYDDVISIREKEIPYRKNIPNIYINSSTYERYKAEVQRKMLKIYESYFKSTLYALHKTYETLNSRGYMVILVGSATLSGLEIPIHSIIAEHFETQGALVDAIYYDKIRRKRITFRRNNRNPYGINGEYIIILRKISKY